MKIKTTQFSFCCCIGVCHNSKWKRNTASHSVFRNYKCQRKCELFSAVRSQWEAATTLDFSSPWAGEAATLAFQRRTLPPFCWQSTTFAAHLANQKVQITQDLPRTKTQLNSVRACVCVSQLCVCASVCKTSSSSVMFVSYIQLLSVLHLMCCTRNITVKFSGHVLWNSDSRSLSKKKKRK